MRVGIATDHGGFLLKEELLERLRTAGHDVVDFGAYQLDPSDDYPDIIVPLARAVAAGNVLRGIAICAVVWAPRYAPTRSWESAPDSSTTISRPSKGVQDDNMNVICMGGRTVGPAVAWDLVQAFLACEFSRAERHIRRLDKVASLELNLRGQPEIQ
jgi:ribose 5-phosphate isomerase B